MRRVVTMIGSVLRVEPTVLRRMPAVLLLIAAGLTAWVFELGAVLQGQAQVRNWSTVWVGLDVMEITGLLLIVLLLRRRSAYLPIVAAATAMLFALDAWFDVMMAPAGGAWYQSLATAFLGEIPMAVVLGAIAFWSVRRADRGRSGELTSVRRADRRRPPGSGRS